MESSLSLLSIWESMSPELKSFLVWFFLFSLLCILSAVFVEAWLFYKRAAYKHKIEWSMIEIKIPREVKETPQAMEQFLMNVHGLRNSAGDFMEKYVDGEVTLWWSLEIVGMGGSVRFFIRTPKKHKKMVEAGLYAQYPNAETITVEDYMDTLPETTKEIYQKGYNVFGSEFLLRKPDPYPITVFRQFELSKEELAIDPISALIEVLSGVHKDEMVGLQIIIAPAGIEWIAETQKLVDKLSGKKKMKPMDAAQSFGDDDRMVMNLLTPGEREVLTAIETNMTKPAFETMVRFIYYAPNAIFNTNFARRGMIGALNQYASPSLNSFKNNYDIETRLRWIKFPHLFIKKRTEARKQRLLMNYREREMHEELLFGRIFTSHPWNFNNKSHTFILSATEVATMFHVPTEKVLTSPHIRVSESKKMGPPSGLPIFQQK